jgi:hypothetical protein
MPKFFKWVYRISMDSNNKRTIELLGKLLSAAKRAQDEGKNLALNKIILEANRLSKRLNTNLLKAPPSPNVRVDFSQVRNLDDKRDSEPRKMFFTEALYLKNKQALAQQAKHFVHVRGVVVD